MTILIERLATESFIPREVRYLDVFSLFPVFDKLAANQAGTVIVGPKGIGKSTAVAAWCALRNVPMIVFDCSEDVRRSHLIGMWILRGNETVYVLGPVSTAFEVANEAGRAVLVLEEFNALTPQCQKLLNPLLDWRRRIEVPEAKRVFSLHEKSKLWVVGTMNTAVYGGVYQLNEDMKSRLRVIALDYPDENVERAMIVEVLKDKGALPSKASILDGVLTLARETRQKSLDYALAPRDNIQILEDVAALGLDRALQLALGKFDGEDRVTVRQRMTSIFAGVKLP